MPDHEQAPARLAELVAEIPAPEAVEDRAEMQRDRVAHDSGEVATRQEVVVKKDDLSGDNEQTAPSRTTLEAAAEVGIENEGDLKQLGVLLGSGRTPLDQNILLKNLIGRKGYRTNPEELLGIVRDYRTESIRSSEKGLLLHYHQTAIDNLEDIVRNGALLSQNAQREQGKEFKSTGARPDVVQMTRDKYDSEGNLVDAGLKEGSGDLIAHGGLAFVFDETIMDEPDYDSIDKYPDLPSIPLDKLVAVVVDDEKDMRRAQEELRKGRIYARVVPRSDWLKGY
jgi:hypothetical protein